MIKRFTFTIMIIWLLLLGKGFEGYCNEVNYGISNEGGSSKANVLHSTSP